MSKLQIIQDHISGHERMQKVLSQLSAEQMAIKFLGEWSVKDVIAHLTGWHLVEMQEIEEMLAGTFPKNEEINDEEMHKINEREVSKRSTLSFQEVQHEWETSYKVLIERLDSLKEEDLEKTLEKNGKVVSLASIFSYSYEEDEHTKAHAKQIEKYFDLD